MNKLPPGWNIDRLAARIKRLPSPEELLSPDVPLRFLRLEVEKISVVGEDETFEGHVEVWVHQTVESFLKALAQSNIALPMMRICTPWGETGDVYYVFEDADAPRIHMFRGTYGYGGTGPHQSATIEAWIAKWRPGVSIETRNGAYLLSALRLT